MKNIPTPLQIPALRNVLSGRTTIPKTELRNFYQAQSPSFNEQLFRRALYALEAKGILLPLGAGMYAVKEKTSSKAYFSYTPSKQLSSLDQVLRRAFPYLDYLCWETSLLHEFMTHQPGQSVYIVEVEKDACESVFNRLREKFSSRVFLKPTRNIMEMYVLHQTDPIIVIPLISQSPSTSHKGIPFPKLEKILVDTFADDNIFYAFQGEELSNIFTRVFDTYWVNERTMFRYASRRKTGKKLAEFIHKKTKIQLALQEKNNR